MRKGGSGLALIIVAGVLGLLAALAMAFTTLAQIERRASRQRLYATKARLLARSGIEDALARISVGQDLGLPGNAYRGEDWDDDGAVTGLESAAEIHQPGQANLSDCPVRHAMAPSFFKRHGSDTDYKGRRAPAGLRVGGRERGYSGLLAGDRAPLGNTYALKVEDESAKINVNGGFLDARDRDGIGGAGDGIPDHRDTDVQGVGAPYEETDEFGEPTGVWIYPGPDANDPGLGWNRQLARILGILGAQPEVGIATLGTDVLANRPVGGYLSIADLQQRIGTTKDLSPYLTTRSWIDLKVIRPNGFDGASYSDIYSALSGVKKTRKPLSWMRWGERR